MPWLEIANASAYAFVTRKQIRPDDWDDFFQTARLVCWQANQDWRPGTDRRSFLSSRAWCRMLDMLREPGYGQEIGRREYREGARRQSVPLDLAETFADGQPFTRQVEQRIDLDRALERITPRLAAVVQLVDFEDVKQDDLSGAFGVHPSRISQIRTAALQELRPLLAA